MSYPPLTPSSLISSGVEAEVYAYGPDKVVRIYKREVHPSCLEIDGKIAYYLSQLPWFIGYYGLKNFLLPVTHTTPNEIRVGEIYERGETTLGLAMLEEKLGTLDKVSIFTCLLLALQTAQTQYQFIHRDLHPGNIVLKLNPIFPRIVTAGAWRVTEYKYSPRIIDYGTASLKLNNDVVLTGCAWERDENLVWNELPNFIEELFREEWIISQKQPTEFGNLLRELERLNLEDIDENLNFLASRYPDICQRT